MPYLIDIGKCYDFHRRSIIKNRVSGFGYDLYSDTIKQVDLLPNVQYNLPSGNGTLLNSGGSTSWNSSWSTYYTHNLFNKDERRYKYSVTYYVYYKSFEVPAITSIYPIFKDIRTILTSLTFTEGNRTLEVKPAVLSTLPSAPIIAGQSTLAENANALLGRTNCNIRFGYPNEPVGQESNVISITVNVISRVTRSITTSTYQRNVFFGIPGGERLITASSSSSSRELALPFNIEVLSNIITKAKEEVSVGNNNSEIYTIRENQLITDNATYVENNVTTAITNKIADDVLGNYSMGKSIVEFVYPHIPIRRAERIIGVRPDQSLITETPPPTMNMQKVNYLAFLDDFGNYEYTERNGQTPKIYEMQSVVLKRNKWICSAIEMIGG